MVADRGVHILDHLFSKDDIRMKECTAKNKVRLVSEKRRNGQVLNPGLGNLELLLECCNEARPLADKISYLLNTNQYTSPIEDNLKKEKNQTSHFCWGQIVYENVVTGDLKTLRLFSSSFCGMVPI